MDGLFFIILTLSNLTDPLSQYNSTSQVTKQTTEIQILNSSKNGFEFIYTPTQFDPQTEPYLLNANTQPEPGNPALPVKYISIGIPIGAEINLESYEMQTEELRDKEVPPAKGIIIKNKNPAVYSNNALWPPEIVKIEERNIYRRQEIIKLRINPVRYNPISKTMVVDKKLRIKINFSGGKGTNFKDNAFEDVFKATLLNYEQAKYWRLDKPLKTANKGNRKYSTGPWFKIPISSEGIYKITKNQLDSAAGITNIDPTTIKIYNGGSKMYTEITDSLIEIPIYVTQDTSILFYATALEGWGKNDSTFFNPFSNTNIYWITYGYGAGNRDSIQENGTGTTPSYFTDTIHVEQDNECPAKSGLNSIWEKIERPSSSSSISKDYTFSAYNKYDDSYKIKIVIYGWYTDRTDERDLSNTMLHNIRIYLNNTQCFTTSWTGGQDGSNSRPVKVFEASGTGLKNGSNIFRLELFKDVSQTKDIVFFDFFEIEYKKLYKANNGNLKFNGIGELEISDFQQSPTIFNISDRLKPVRVYNTSFDNGTAKFHAEGQTYYASCNYKTITLLPESPFNLRNKTTSLKNIIITHPDFLNYAIRLRDFRNNYGMPTEVFLTTDIYNNFSFGLSNSPYAIKNFLTFAYENWGEPSYCLLLGAGTFAYKSSVSKNRIPPIEEGYLVGEYGYPPQDNHCWDDWFTDRNMAVGRVSVKNETEARDAVDKLIKYEASRGPWQNRILFISDDEDPDGNLFINNIKRCAAMVPKEFDILTAYSMNYPLDGNLRKTTARDDIIRCFNKGAFLSIYSGHGNLYQLAHEVLFYNPQDIEALNNSVMNPISQFWSCGVGCFDRIDDDCMADYFQKIYNKGSIATVAAARTTGGSSGMDTLLISLLLKSKLTTVGQAMYGEKLALPLQINENSFGDPATRVPERAINTEINTFPTSIKGGQKYTVKGKAPGAQFAHITVRSSEYDNTYIYKWYPTISGSATYKMRGKMIDNQICEDILFEATTEVKNGEWEQEFFIPTLDSAIDSTLCGNLGKIGVFAWNENLCGSASRDINVTWGQAETGDTSGPKVILFANGNLIKSNTVVPSSFTFSAILEDESGINTFNKIKPLNLALTLRIKSGALLPVSYQLADYFQYDIGSCTRGKISYLLDLGNDKEDTLELQVSDNIGNRSVATTTLKIESAEKLTITKVLNFPNPVRGEHTWFNFFLSKQAQVTIKIYTVTGRLIQTITPSSNMPDGPNKIYWDTRDKLTNRIGNGIYIYKITAKGINEDASETSKLMILR